MAGDDGWDDPVPLPEDDDNGPAAYGAVVPPPAAPASAPAASATPAPAPAPSGGSTSGRRTGLLAGGGLAVVAIAVVAVIALTGGNPKPKHHTTTTPVRHTTSNTLSHAQFISRGNAICSQALPAIAADDQAQNFSATASDDETMANAFAALNTSSADSATVRELVRAIDAAVSALQAGNFTNAQAAGNTFSQLAGEAGLSTCSG